MFAGRIIPRDYSGHNLDFHDARAWVSTTANKETLTEEDLPSANSIEPKDRKTQK